MNELEQRIKYLEDALAMLIKSDRYTVQKDLQLFDGRKIQTGYTTGATICSVGGASGQKLGFFGVTPVVQQQLSASPNAAQIEVVLHNFGLTYH